MSDADLHPLRAERQWLLEEVERLAWLRRVVVARRDVEVARLAGFGPDLWGGGVLPDVVRVALEHDAGHGPRLLGALCASEKALAAATVGTRRDLDRATCELLRRYATRPALCLSAVSATGR